MLSKAICLFGILFITDPLSILGQDEKELAHFQAFFSKKQGSTPEDLIPAYEVKLEQAREIHDGREESLLLKDLGLIYLTRAHNYEKAMDLFIQALAIEDSLYLEEGKVLTYVAVARVFEVVGDFHSSANFLNQAMKLNHDRQAINTVAMILNNLGKVNAARGNVKDAFENYRQVLRYKADISKEYEAEAHFNLAHLQTLQGEHAAALESHKKSLALTREISDKYMEAVSLNEIGILYGLMGNENKSLANHLVSLDIRQSLSDKRGMAESLNNLGWLYLKLGESSKAIANGLMALDHGRETQSQDQIYKSYDLLSQSHKALGDYKNALMYKELTLAIYEFIQGEKQERQLLETQNRYVIGKTETQIQKLDALGLEREREIASQKKFRNILFLAVGLVVITAGLLLILYLVKRRSNRILQVAKKEVQNQNARLHDLNQTKDKFFSIISHDLKGPLNSLTSFSRLLIDHTDRMSREEIQLLAKDLDKSVKNLLILLENLLEWARSQTGNIDFTGEVFDLAQLLENNKNLLDTQAGAKRITIKIEGSKAMSVKLHKQSVNTVLRNLISNAIKFTPENGIIRVGTQIAGGRLQVFVEDNGVGMSGEVVEKLFRLDSKHSTKGTANEKGTGLGLILCREFVEKNGGKIHVQSTPGNGTAFTLSFPVTTCCPAVVALRPVSL